MLMPKKMKGMKKSVLIVVVIFIILVIIYLVYTNLFSGKIELIKPLELDINISVTPSLDPNLAADFLKKMPYTGLKQSGQLPVKVDKTGRNNPFLIIPFLLLEP